MEKEKSSHTEESRKAHLQRRGHGALAVLFVLSFVVVFLWWALTGDCWQALPIGLALAVVLYVSQAGR